LGSEALVPASEAMGLPEPGELVQEAIAPLTGLVTLLAPVLGPAGWGAALISSLFGDSTYCYVEDAPVEEVEEWVTSNSTGIADASSDLTRLNNLLEPASFDLI